MKKKKKDNNMRNVAIATGILALLIIIPILVREPRHNSYEYNGFEFTEIDGMWYTQVQKLGTNNIYQLELRYDPKSLEDIPVEGNPKDFLNMLEHYNLTATYITFDPTGKNLTQVALVAADISGNLAKVMNIVPIAACIKNETEACSTRPIITCDNDDSAVIYIKDSEQPKITTETNCLIVEGREHDLLKASNKLLLMWYSIMS